MRFQNLLAGIVLLTFCELGPDLVHHLSHAVGVVGLSALLLVQLLFELDCLLVELMCVSNVSSDLISA